ncbi:MAG: GGDEF-domain containing protein [Micrococcales bacterium]|nr:MAG: GGDEF-domain containing protein [Micrococcales bacterium]
MLFVFLVVSRLFVNHWAATSLSLTAAILLCSLVAVFTRGLRDEPGQTAWWVMTAAYLVAIFATIYQQRVVLQNPGMGWLTWADVGRGAFVVLSYVALSIQLRARIQDFHPGLVLDGLLVALTTLAVGTQFLFADLFASIGDLQAAVVQVLYPVGAILLMSVGLAGITMLGRQVDRQWLLMASALLALGTSDIVRLSFPRPDIRSTGSFVVETTLLAGACLVTCAAADAFVAPARGQSRDERYRAQLNASSGIAVLALPFAATALSLLLVLPLGGWEAQRMAQWVAGGALVLGAMRGFVTIRSVRMLAEARIEAGLDGLTRLANRRGLENATAAWFSNSENVDEAALVLCNLDEFKEINAALGEIAGDLMLAEVAQRLRETTAPGEVVARLGGDEFALFVPGANMNTVAEAVDRMTDILIEPFQIGGATVRARMSVGVSLAPRDGNSLSGLLRSADTALNHAKLSHADYAVFDPASTRDTVDAWRVSEFRAALTRNELVLHYQPKADLVTGVVTGVEALVRWQHPVDGLLYPDAFLPMVDRAALMPAMTDVIIEQALRQLATWKRAGRSLTMSINLPPASVVDSQLPDRLCARLETYGLQPGMLTLEITEESLLNDRIRAREVLAQLRSRGVSVSIDDYGTGYSSLAYLRELPVDELKLDRSFILPMSKDERAAKIVQSTVHLAHSLGLAIVAEGVEDHEAAMQLGEYGCDVAQGYFYSKPVPAEQLEAWLDARPRGDLHPREPVEV